MTRSYSSLANVTVSTGISQFRRRVAVVRSRLVERGGAWEEESSFVFGFGLRLQKAPDFEPLSVHRDPDVPVQVILCVNEQGEVIGEAG